MRGWRLVGWLLILFPVLGHSAESGDLPTTSAEGPTPILFDTDMGNDIDDALALGLIHALQDRGQCRLVAVTVSKGHPDSAAYCALINDFYGRPEIPVGIVRDGKTPEPSKFAGPVVGAKTPAGAARFAHIPRDDFPDAVGVLRKSLASLPDQSAVIVMVGFSTNLAQLLESPADADSPLTGKELVQRKCRLLSMMAGMFTPDRVKEYNVHVDIASCRKVLADWPTPIVVSGFEIGRAIKYPADSIEKDFGYVDFHPIREGYRLYQKMPYDRETWDLTSVLCVVYPDRGYFGYSPPGRIEVDDQGVTHFHADPHGRCRYLTVDAGQITRVREAFIHLCSQPPANGRATKRK